MSPTPSRKEPLEIKRIDLNLDDLSAALKIAPNTVTKHFSDGRVASRFGECWGSALYGFALHSNTNARGSDGSAVAGGLGSMRVSVKSLTQNGVRFQNSVNIGAGRSCTNSDLEAAIRAVERVLIVDIVNFPTVDFILLRNAVLLDWTSRGILTHRGLAKRGFYTNLRESFEPYYVNETSRLHALFLATVVANSGSTGAPPGSATS